MRRFSIFALLALSFALIGCQSKGPVSSQTAIPAANTGIAENHRTENGGRVLGDPGILLSGWAGGGICAALNEADRVKNQQAERRAFTAQVGQQVTWNNAENGHSGTVIPLRDGYNNNGAYCRDFKQTVNIGGQQKQGNAHACQQPDGSWKIAR